MEVAQISSVLSQLTEPVVSIQNGLVSVFIPAIDDTVAWQVANTRRTTCYYGPTGDLAVEFVIEADGEEWPLIQDVHPAAATVIPPHVTTCTPPPA